MEDRPLSFVSNHHHRSANALTSVGSGDGLALQLPSSPLHTLDAANRSILKKTDPHSQLSMLYNKPLTALNLSTYTAGEDGGRLAMLAKEFGLARMRPPKPQHREHAFKAFLRNHPDNLNEDIQQPAQTKTECRDNNIPQSDDTSKTHAPLRFVFSGYSLWLELEQQEIDNNGQGDLDRAMIDAADRFRLGGAIPSPHVTALYGIDTVSEEDEIRRIFREDVKRVLLEDAEKRRRRRRKEESATKEDGDDDDDDDDGEDKKMWPDLAATGIIVGAEFDGVNGGTMDMAWAEVSLATSPEHETLIDALYDIFYHRSAASAEVASSFSSGEEKKEEYVPRSNPWVPHLSLCYDNPEGFGPNLSRSSIEKFMKEKCPTLENVLDDSDGGDVKFTVSGISLWKTAGTMNDWKCLDRHEFSPAG
eukprot:CAMPEP_0172302698 /NCGR_PEP_ID=MMETSP1058-20130122/4368_1 /TAXON_ID=83371 /ORGANISM="Detonula confervacea, Strain CCMP 353" /LENGTH=418 /DNA_ID=CAMNT_0013013273 /DNA_START=59 /DNA_END=1315 /DNA_ORIENTATION=-